VDSLSLLFLDFFGVSEGTLPLSEYKWEISQCESDSNCEVQACVWAHSKSKPFDRWCFSHSKHHGLKFLCLDGDNCRPMHGCNSCHTKALCSVHSVFHGSPCSSDKQCENKYCGENRCHSSPWCSIHSKWHNSVCPSGTACDEIDCTKFHEKSWCTVHKKWDGLACPKAAHRNDKFCSGHHAKAWCETHFQYHDPPCTNSCPDENCSRCSHPGKWCADHKRHDACLANINCSNGFCGLTGLCHSSPWCSIHSKWHNSVCPSGTACDEIDCTKFHEKSWCTVHKKWDGLACPKAAHCNDKFCSGHHAQEWCENHSLRHGSVCYFGESCSKKGCPNCHKKTYCLRHKVHHGPDCEAAPWRGGKGDRTGGELPPAGMYCRDKKCTLFHERNWCEIHSFHHFDPCPFGENCFKRNCELCHPHAFCNVHNIFHGVCCSEGSKCNNEGCKMLHVQSWCEKCCRWDGSCNRHDHNLALEVIGMRTSKCWLVCYICSSSIHVEESARVCRRADCNSYAGCLLCFTTSKSIKAGDCHKDIKCKKKECVFSHSRSWCIYHDIWHKECNECDDGCDCSNKECCDYHSGQSWCNSCSRHHGDCSEENCDNGGDCDDEDCVRMHDSSWCNSCSRHHGDCSDEYCINGDNCSYEYCPCIHFSRWCKKHDVHHGPCTHNHPPARRLMMSDFFCGYCNETTSIDKFCSKIAFFCGKCSYYECSYFNNDIESRVSGDCNYGLTCSRESCRFSHDSAWCDNAKMWHQTSVKARQHFFSSTEYICDGCI
jgi:hypothetical protein